MRTDVSSGVRGMLETSRSSMLEENCAEPHHDDWSFQYQPSVTRNSVSSVSFLILLSLAITPPSCNWISDKSIQPLSFDFWCPISYNESKRFRSHLDELHLILSEQFAITDRCPNTMGKGQKMLLGIRHLPTKILPRKKKLPPGQSGRARFPQKPGTQSTCTQEND